MGEDEFLRVRLGQVGERLVATPLQRGAGVISSLVRADGLALIPRGVEGVEAGAEVEVQLLKPLSDVLRTIVAIGSQDMILDLIASRLSGVAGGVGLSSANVGSVGGLLALRRGEAHIAGTHLMDEETGEYNVSYIQTLRAAPRDRASPPGRAHAGADGRARQPARHNVARGPRKAGRALRQPPARLRHTGSAGLPIESSAGIDADSIRGYEREEYTHLAVAAAVSGGKAETGLGILPAATAMGLDFVPLFGEDYDLAIPVEFYESELLAPLLGLIRSPEFRAEVEALGGYDASADGGVEVNT